MKLAAYRWILFLSVGLPFQIMVYAIYPFIWLFWRLFIFKDVEKTEPSHKESFTDEEYFLATDSANSKGVLINDDDHGAFTQYGVGPQALVSLADPKTGDLYRTPAGAMNHVSGDVVVAWAFAFSLLFKEQRHHYKDLASKVAWNYLKYLGTTSLENGKRFVSTRCNNFGINFCPDSTVLGLGQPAGGPQFYTSSAIFAVAAEHDKMMRLVFWVHWVVMGGWYWAFFPIVTPKDGMYYVRDISMKALWAHREIFGEKWWIRKPMVAINKTVPVKNALFEAMLGRELMKLPEVMHAFFSQEKHASSNQELFDSNKRINGWIRTEIAAIYIKSHLKK